MFGIGGKFGGLRFGGEGDGDSGGTPSPKPTPTPPPREFELPTG